jgi:uncharacterized protein
MLDEFHIFTVEGVDILLHISTSRIFRIDHLTKEVFKKCRENVSEKGMVSQIEPGYSRKQICEVIDELNFISASNKTPTPTNLIAEDSLRVDNILLNLAEVCNLSCTYCSVKTYCSAKQGNYGHGEKFMSWEVAKAAIDMTLQQKGCAEYVIVCFFGGEPLLNFSLLERVTLYAKEQFTANGKRVGFSVATNGTLLNSSMIKFLNEHNFGIMISIDGPEVIHNRYRKFKNGRGSYQKVVENLQELIMYWEGASSKANIGAGATITPAEPDLYEIANHLGKMGFTEIILEPVSPLGNKVFYFQKDSLAKYKMSFQHLVKSWEESLIGGRFLNIYHNIYPINEMLRMIHKREIKQHHCGAGRSFLAVSAEGYLYPCHLLLCQKDYQIGSVFEGIDESLRLRVLPRYVDKKKKCSSCWARYFCGGGCPGEQFRARDSDDCPMLWRCDLFKYEMELCIWLYTVIKDLRPEFLDIPLAELFAEGKHNNRLDDQV